MKRVVSFFMSLVLLITASAFAVHAEGAEDVGATPMPCYAYTQDVTNSLSISNGQAKCRSYLMAQSDITKIDVKMTLQKKTLLWWSTEKAWAYTYYLITEADNTEYYNVGGGTYRVKTEFTVVKGSDSETFTKYSNEVTV